MGEWLRIFVDVLVPVFFVAGVGAFAATRWSLDYRPMSSIAYNFLAPAFVFRLLVDPAGVAGSVVSMVVSSVATVVVVFAVVFALSRRLAPDRRTLDALASSFGNVGNLGFPIVLFAFGEDALPAAGVHFLAITISAFFLGIAASARLRSGTAAAAVRRVVTTPAIAVAPIAVVINLIELDLPAFANRSIGLLADAMIPVMLLTLGMQLVTTRLVPKVSRLSGIALAKLVLAPMVFLLVARLVDLTGTARDSGVVLAAMPTAVLVGLISMEYDLETEMASAAILATSLASVGTVGLLLSVL